MKTLSILIGNSDNKLTQAEWAEFFHATDRIIQQYEWRRHFSACSSGCSPWQNACWVVVIEGGEEKVEKLKENLSVVRALYKQESVAIVIGSETEYV